MVSNIVMSKSQILLFAAHLCAHNKKILSTQNGPNNSPKFNQLFLHKRGNGRGLWNKRITISQNHRTIRVGRNLIYHLVQTHLWTGTSSSRSNWQSSMHLALKTSRDGASRTSTGHVLCFIPCHCIRGKECLTKSTVTQLKTATKIHIFWWNIIGLKIHCDKLSLRVSTLLSKKWTRVGEPLGIPIA